MDLDEPSLHDLAAAAGAEARTIRSWVQQGLIPGPEALGRNARYPAGSLTRVRAISAMRNLYGMSLQAIRQELLVAPPETIAGYAAQTATAAGLPAALPAGEAPPGSTAAEYLQSLRASGAFEVRPSAIPAASRPPSPSGAEAPASRRGSPLNRLVQNLEAPLGRSAPRKSRGEVRMAIPITPEVELTLRGKLAPDEIAAFEHLADVLREWLNGGTKE